MVKYGDKVIKNASELTIDNLKQEESRWGLSEQEDWSKVSWA